MFHPESHQLAEDVVVPPAAGVAVGRAAGHHLVGDAAEPPGHADADVAGVLALQLPAGGQDAEVVVVIDQVVGDHHDGPAEPAVGAADQLAVGAIDRVALVPRGYIPARPVIAREQR